MPLDMSAGSTVERAAKARTDTAAPLLRHFGIGPVPKTCMTDGCKGPKTYNVITLRLHIFKTQEMYESSKPKKDPPVLHMTIWIVINMLGGSGLCEFGEAAMHLFVVQIMINDISKHLSV